MTPPFLKCLKPERGKYKTKLLMQTFPKTLSYPSLSASFWAPSHAKDMKLPQPMGHGQFAQRSVLPISPPVPEQLKTSHTSSKESSESTSGCRQGECVHSQCFPWTSVDWGRLYKCKEVGWAERNRLQLKILGLPANVIREGGQQNPRVF